ncbi:MAG: GIY-YIG nuclease family protein [Hyphomicrobiaceae bacterium]|nr:GIY-YIG nuclease family protein [Hyphomicrobiaceae bacterium]
MTGYVYVVRSPNFSACKVGHTKDLRGRLSGLRSNSAAPWHWYPWQAYQLESIHHARQLEQFVKSDPCLVAELMPGKREFFGCSPNMVTSRIVALANEHSIALIGGFPYNITMVEELAGNFPSLPSEILKSLPEETIKSYWIGVRDFIRALTYLDGITVKSEDVWRLWVMANHNAEADKPMLWSTVLDFYRNSSDSRNRDVANMAIEQAAKDERIAWEDWQKDYKIEP